MSPAILIVNWRREITTMNSKKFKSLDLDKLEDKKLKIVSTKEALSDVTPISWGEEVLSGKKKIIVDYKK